MFYHSKWFCCQRSLETDEWKASKTVKNSEFRLWFFLGWRIFFSPTTKSQTLKNHNFFNFQYFSKLLRLQESQLQQLHSRNPSVESINLISFNGKYLFESQKLKRIKAVFLSYRGLDQNTKNNYRKNRVLLVGRHLESPIVAYKINC